MTEENQEQEFIDEVKDEGQEESKPLTVLDMLQYELREHMAIALDYKKKIDEGKTKAKKEYFLKKLKKNNIQATKILTAMERLSRRKDRQDIKDNVGA